MNAQKTNINFSTHEQVCSFPLPVGLPFFSMASTSLIRRGGAMSGGANCSARSGRTKAANKQNPMIMFNLGPSNASNNNEKNVNAK